MVLRWGGLRLGWVGGGSSGVSRCGFLGSLLGEKQREKQMSEDDEDVEDGEDNEDDFGVKMIIKRFVFPDLLIEFLEKAF